MQTLQKLKNRVNIPSFGRGVWTIAFINVVGSTGFATAYTYLSLYLYQDRHIPMTLVGLMFLISGISSAVLQIIGGITGDRYGYRRMVIIYSSAGVLASVIQAILIGMRAPTWSVVLVTILRSPLGGMAGPSFNAIITSVSPKGRLTESYSLLTIAGTVGWVIGPVLGGHLLGIISYGWLIGFGAAMQTLGLVGALFLPQDRDKRDSERLTFNRLKSLISNKALVVVSLLALLFFLTLSQWGGTLSVFTVDRIGFTKEQYGLLLSISSIVVVIFQYPISRRVQRANTRPILVLACLFYTVGFLSLAWVRTFIRAVGSTVIMVTGEMLFIPTVLSVVGQISRPEDRAKSMGLYGLCQGLGFSLGPLLGGFLLDRFPKTPLLLWGPVSLCPLMAAIGFAFWKGYTQDTENA